MAEHKIKFEYKDAGKASSGIRQKLAASQRKAAGSPGGGGLNSNFIKTLNTSFQNLTKSNEKLIAALNKSAVNPKSPGSSIPRGGGGGAGFGGIGASIPIAGAAIALTGFVVKKMQQITEAYIGKIMEQKGSMGLGGFQAGAKGVYLGAERSAGRKAYATSAGKFGAPGMSRAEQQVGGVYGLSAAEVRGQAGLFQRTGQDFGKTAYQALGAGVSTELPALMTGIAAELEDAVRKGVNTSELSSDFGKNIARLAMRTESKSVAAALDIVKSYKSVKEGVGKGGIAGIEALYSRQASQEILNERLQDPKVLERLYQNKDISEKQYQTLQGFKGKPGELQTKIGTGSAEYLTRKMSREVDPVELLQKQYEKIKTKRGTGVEAYHEFSNFAQSQNFSITPDQIKTQWFPGLMEKPGGEKRGKNILTEQSKNLGALSGAVTLAGAKEKLTTSGLSSGIAQKTIGVETAMLKMISEFSGKAAAGISEIPKILSSIEKKLAALEELKGFSKIVNQLFLPKIIKKLSSGNSLME